VRRVEVIKSSGFSVKCLKFHLILAPLTTRFKFQLPEFSEIIHRPKDVFA
jgi:hypothetical protein